MLWDLLDKKVVWSRDIVFMEDKKIEDWKQQNTVLSSQPATFMESALADPSSTQPTGRQQSADETESEPISTQQQADTHESKLEMSWQKKRNLSWWLMK